MRRTKKVGNLRLKNHQSILDLRDRGMRELRKAVRATNNAHALFALADKRERDAQKAVDDYYFKLQQEEKGGASINEEDAFNLGHLGRGK